MLRNVVSGSNASLDSEEFTERDFGWGWGWHGARTGWFVLSLKSLGRTWVRISGGIADAIHAPKMIMVVTLQGCGDCDEDKDKKCVGGKLDYASLAACYNEANFCAMVSDRYENSGVIVRHMLKSLCFFRDPTR